MPVLSNRPAFGNHLVQLVSKVSLVNVKVAYARTEVCVWLANPSRLGSAKNLVQLVYLGFKFLLGYASVHRE